jgi:predicted RNA-binding Zn-ribbon protein involved in translation (DUF1610 family)
MGHTAETALRQLAEIRRDRAAFGLLTTGFVVALVLGLLMAPDALIAKLVWFAAMAVLGFFALVLGSKYSTAVCPNCGKQYFYVGDDALAASEMSWSSCVHCGIRLDGGNVWQYFSARADEH